MSNTMWGGGHRGPRPDWGRRNWLLYLVVSLGAVVFFMAGAVTVAAVTGRWSMLAGYAEWAAGAWAVVTLVMISQRTRWLS
jgi:hypothetical protein